MRYSEYVLSQEKSGNVVYLPGIIRRISVSHPLINSIVKHTFYFTLDLYNMGEFDVRLLGWVMFSTRQCKFGHFSDELTHRRVSDLRSYNAFARNNNLEQFTTRSFIKTTPMGVGWVPRASRDFEWVEWNCPKIHTIDQDFEPTFAISSRPPNLSEKCLCRTWPVHTTHFVQYHERKQKINNKR